MAIYQPSHNSGGQRNDWNDRTEDPIGLTLNGIVEIVPDASQRSTANVARPAVVTINPTPVITNDSGSLKLQWPISASNYMLEATTNLTHPFTMSGYP